MLHRETWPSVDNEQRDSELKRRFEDGLANSELTKYLRLHARDCSFSATVLKARQCVDAAENTRPQKKVRILKNATQVTEPSVNEDETVSFQPLIQGIREAFREVVVPALPNINQVTRGQPPGRQGQNQIQGPQGSRSQSPAPPDHHPDNRQSRPMDRGNSRFNRPQGNGRYNLPARPFQSPGPRQQSPGTRFQPQGQRFQPYERPTYQPQGPRFQPPGRPNFQPPGRVSFQDQGQDFQRSRSPASATYYNQQEFLGRRSPSPAPRYDRAPTPRYEREPFQRQSYQSRDQPQDYRPEGPRQQYQDRDEPQAPFLLHLAAPCFHVGIWDVTCVVDLAVTLTVIRIYSHHLLQGMMRAIDSLHDLPTPSRMIVLSDVHHLCHPDRETMPELRRRAT